MREAPLTMDFPPRSQPDLAPADLSQLGFPRTEYHHPLIQQVHGLYGVDGDFAFTQQAHLPGGRFATTQNHPPYLFSLPTVLLRHSQYDAEIARSGLSEPGLAVSAAPAGPASTMEPPVRPRKHKAPTLRADDWEPYKKRILDLHATQKLPLPKVRQMIEEEYGFKAELRQYRTRISQWGKDKNVKPQEMKAIVRKRQKRKLVETDKRELIFEVRNRQVESQKIERWMKRHGVADSFLHEPSPAASTPSAVGCHTVSERGSPALVSTYSPVASVSSPGGVYIAAQIPQMPSPTLSSVSSIVRLQDSAFTGQSPALTYQSLVGLRPGSNAALSMFESQMHVDARPRYRQDEEDCLRDQISRAEMSFVSGAEERSGIFHELGSVFIDQGRYKAAEDVIRKLVESHESQRSNGGDDADTLRALYLLDRVLDCQGLHTTAERLHRLVLAGRETVLGPEHPSTLASVNDLGLVLSRRGKYEEAEAMHQRALKGREKVLGPEHLDTLTSKVNLASTFRSRGRLKEAEDLEVRVIESAATFQTPDHAVNGMAPFPPSGGNESIKISFDSASYRRAKREMLANGWGETQVFGRKAVDVDTLILGFADPRESLPVPTWAARMANKMLPTVAIPIRLASAYLLTKIMRWLVWPSVENMNAMPEWLMPISRQDVSAYDMLADLLPWPQLRQYVYQHTEEFTASALLALLGHVCITWPYPDEFCHYWDIEAGCTRLTPYFETHISELSSWTLDVKALEFIPQVENMVPITR